MNVELQCRSISALDALSTNRVCVDMDMDEAQRAQAIKTLIGSLPTDAAAKLLDELRTEVMA